MRLLESGQMYLESIFVLSKQSIAVRSIDVCEYMGFSKPSVSRAIGLLKSGGYVVADKNGYLSLTPLGLDIAQKVYERHELLTEFLVRIGVDPEIASEDACKIEHDISEETLDCLRAHLARVCGNGK